MFSAQGGSKQITLFLKNILFVLGSSQTSNMSGVCSGPNPELRFVCQIRVVYETGH